jgi:hypothetical protein
MNIRYDIYIIKSLQVGKSLSGITAGPLLGIFTLGMFFPIANSTVSVRNALWDKSVVCHENREWFHVHLFGKF